MNTPRKWTVLATTTAGTLFALAAVAPAEAALSDCPSGSVCLWSGTKYRGTMKAISTAGSYRSIGLPSVNSYYNNRAKRTWLHQSSDGSGSYTCLNPDARSSDLSGWQETAKAVYLATVTDC
jgi:hypothetical protein